MFSLFSLFLTFINFKKIFSMLCTSVLDRLQNLTRDVELLFVDDKKMMKIKQFMGIRRFGTGEVRAFLFGCQRGRTFRTGCQPHNFAE